MPNLTSNYSLYEPLVNNATDQDLWGGYLNTNMVSIDTLLRTGITVATSAKTSTFSADASISAKYLYLCDATGGAIAANLPAAATAGDGPLVIFKKTDSSSNAVTVTANGAETIDGSNTYVLLSQNDFVAIVCNGTSWSVISRTQKKLSINIQKFTGSGTYTPTSGMAYCIAEGVGGGGGGGGGNSVGAGIPGAGGGGAAYARIALSAAQIGTSQTVTIGAAGTAGATGTSGGNGGSTSLGSLLVAAGGIGGAANITGPVSGGLGGSTGTGTIIIPGTQGQVGGANTGFSVPTSFGGNSYLGTGAPSVSATNTAGSAAISYGGGGGGGTGTGAGGLGAAGILLVTEFIFT